MASSICCAFLLASATTWAQDEWDQHCLLESEHNAWCEEDLLGASFARGRIEWSLKHYPVTVAQFYSFLTVGRTDYNLQLGDLTTVMEMARKDWLTTANGQPRPRPRYPTWGGGSGNSRNVWHAPTNPKQSKNKPDGVSIRGLCTAAYGWDEKYASNGVYNLRCADDSLSRENARGRVDWSIHYYPATVAEFYSWLTMGNKDYWAALQKTVEETTEMARNEWLKNSAGQLLLRPQYPMWGYGKGDNTQVWSAPKRADDPPDKPDNVSIRALCTSSCYKPSVQLFYASGYKPIKAALESRAPDIITLAPDATLEEPTFQVGQVDRYTIEATDAHNHIVGIETACGGKLEVTDNHPLVDASGHIREARTFEVGQSLVRIDGKSDEIVRITGEDFFGRVYNVTPKGSSLMSQIVVAEGFLSGSAWYQNNGAEYLNRDIFRLNLPDAIVD